MEGSELTYEKSDNGQTGECWNCSSPAVVQYFGHCPSCWMDFTPQQRAVLRGEEPPVKEIIHQTHHVTHYPSRVSVGLFRLWCFAVTAALAWLAWRMR